jgi:hypothetical protein
MAAAENTVNEYFGFINSCKLSTRRANILFYAEGICLMDLEVICFVNYL